MPKIKYKFQYSLTKPLYQRCSDIKILIEEASQKDLQALFPLLVENLFGFNNQQGWGLRTIMRSYQLRDFDTLRSFLSPKGPLFCMIYKLLSDSLLRYEFPISCLPAPTKRILEEGAVPPLYVNKVQFRDQSHNRALLSLNALEYYIFHFAYFIVSHQNNKAMVNCYSPSDALYTTIFEDYLSYFLPFDGGGVPPMPSNIRISPSRTPISHYPFVNRSMTSPSPRSNLTMGGLSFSSKNSPFKKNAPSPSLPAIDYSQNETWRSEMFLQVLVEFWLNQNTLDSNRLGLSHHSSENFLPSNDHMRVVRMLVKHIHFFVNSGCPTMAQSPTFCGYSPFNEFKRSVIPHIIQKKLYAFFRHGFDHWPLDSSFRVILETWLSYIQPWRYTDPYVLNKSRDKEGRAILVDSSWKQFVIDNLLFYSVMFQNFLPRLFRMDLSSPKNAYMLFRVAKVFNQSFVPQFIADGEAVLQEPLGRSSMFPNELYSPGNNPSSTGAILRLHFSELEGPGFSYAPLFGEKCKGQIRQLLGLIAEAETVARNLQRSREFDNGGWLSWLGLGNLTDFNLPGYGYDDFTIADGKKLEFHLKQAALQLCQIFQMEEPKSYDSDPKLANTSQSSLADSSFSEKIKPDTEQGENGPVLTPLGRYQLMNGLAKFDLDYQGDPDLQPIRSYEITNMVRIFHKLAAVINQKYACELEALYYGSNFLSRISRPFLQPPTTISLPQKGSVASPMIVRHLPPRVSFRFLARYQTLGYCFLIIVLYNLFNLGTIPFILILFILFFFYVLIKAFLEGSITPEKRMSPLINNCQYLLK